MKKEIIDTSSLAHTKWNCKYHIVFAPKYSTDAKCFSKKNEQKSERYYANYVNGKE